MVMFCFFRVSRIKNLWVEITAKTKPLNYITGSYLTYVTLQERPFQVSEQKWLVLKNKNHRGLRWFSCYFSVALTGVNNSLIIRDYQTQKSVKNALFQAF